MKKSIPLFAILAALMSFQPLNSHAGAGLWGSNTAYGSLTLAKGFLAAGIPIESAPGDQVIGVGTAYLTALAQLEVNQLLQCPWMLVSTGVAVAASQGPRLFASTLGANINSECSSIDWPASIQKNSKLEKVLLSSGKFTPELLSEFNRLGNELGQVLSSVSGHPQTVFQLKKALELQPGLIELELSNLREAILQELEVRKINPKLLDVYDAVLSQFVPGTLKTY
jgi:hypothetical protein